jgi:Uma2 family endonuclease
MAVDPKFVHKITVDEYVRMGETGILDPRRRYELLEGMLVDVAPQNNPHAYAVIRLTEILVLAARGRYRFRGQLPSILGDMNMPEPDVCLVAPDLVEHPRVGEIFLAIEVSDTTYRLDSKTKLRRYAASGIPEYWIVNLRRRRIEVYRRPEGWAYAESLTVAGDEPVAPLAFGDVPVRYTDLTV